MADNVALEVNGDVLAIHVNLRAAGRASASGKTLVIASTRGNLDVPGHEGVKLGLNVFKGRRAAR